MRVVLPEIELERSSSEKVSRKSDSRSEMHLSKSLERKDRLEMEVCMRLDLTGRKHHCGPDCDTILNQMEVT